MSYYLHSKTGVVKAELRNDIANRLMRECRGFFREANYQSGKKTVFEFNDHYNYGVDAIRILISEGDVLSPKE